MQPYLNTDEAATDPRAIDKALSTDKSLDSANYGTWISIITLCIWPKQLRFKQFQSKFNQRIRVYGLVKMNPQYTPDPPMEKSLASEQLERYNTICWYQLGNTNLNAINYNKQPSLANGDIGAAHQKV